MVFILKVLHIWNTAGVGSIIAKYMDKIYGTKSRVVMRKSFDKFDLSPFLSKSKRRSIRSF